MIANARYGSYDDHALAAPLRSIPPEHTTTIAHTDAIGRPLAGVTNDEMAQRAQFPDAKGSNYVAPARVAVGELTFYLRPMRWRAPWFNGSHGVVRRLRPGSWDSVQRPFVRPNRTLRAAPAAPWDVGTALGPAGYATGEEEAE